MRSPRLFELIALFLIVAVFGGISPANAQSISRDTAPVVVNVPGPAETETPDGTVTPSPTPTSTPSSTEPAGDSETDVSTVPEVSSLPDTGVSPVEQTFGSTIILSSITVISMLAILAGIRKNRKIQP